MTIHLPFVRHINPIYLPGIYILSIKQRMPLCWQSNCRKHILQSILFRYFISVVKTMTWMNFLALPFMENHIDGIPISRAL